jgi:hypothetical protein
VVYEHPSISALAGFACALAHPAQNKGPANKVDEMLSMVETYSRGFPKYHPSVATPSSDVVLVTGTTGVFGSVLLAELVVSKDIIHIFAVNRKDTGGATLVDRQATSLERQGLDPCLPASPKVTLVEGDLGVADLGLPIDVYELVGLHHELSPHTSIDNTHSCRCAHLLHISSTLVRIHLFNAYFY